MKKWQAFLLAAAFLGGCQTAGTVASTQTDPVIAKVVQQQEKTIAYFDDNWELAEKPVTTGYFRKLYGTTAEGRYVVQDFYQANGAKQTDAFELTDEAGFKDGGNRYVTGTIVWYEKDGVKTSMKTLVNGEPKGPSEEYYPSGKLKSRAEPSATGGGVGTVYYENGVKMAVVSTTREGEGGRVRMQTWHPNGKPAVDITTGGRAKGKDKSEPPIKGWDTEGKPLSEMEAALQTLQFTEKLKEVLPEDL